jgi:hypothetical protein
MKTLESIRLASWINHVVAKEVQVGSKLYLANCRQVRVLRTITSRKYTTNTINSPTLDLSLSMFSQRDSRSFRTQSDYDAVGLPSGDALEGGGVDVPISEI